MPSSSPKPRASRTIQAEPTASRISPVAISPGIRAGPRRTWASRKNTVPAPSSRTRPATHSGRRSSRAKKPRSPLKAGVAWAVSRFTTSFWQMCPAWLAHPASRANTIPQAYTAG